ncbi:uncharacterized protein LOC144487598 [Mustelus asterias]
MSHTDEEGCLPRKERRQQESHVDDNMKREAEINDYLNRLERWDKMMKNNISLQEMQASAQQKIYSRQISRINEELKLASRALLIVRQAAMKELVQYDHQQHVKELEMKGKIFYKERI